MPLRADQTHWSTREDKALATCSARAMTSQDTADYLNRTFHDGETIRTEAAVSIRRGKLKLKVAKRVKSAPKTPAPDEETQQTINREESGDEIVLRSFGSEVTTIDELIARAKIDLTKYEVDKPETSMHETTVRTIDGKIRKVQNFRIVARFRLKQGPSTAEQVEALIAGAFTNRKNLYTSPKYIKKTADSKLMQAVVIADPHLAKYAWGAETGWEDYDLMIGSRLLRQATDALTDWGDQYRPAVRHIWLLGDQLHYDNPQGQTTGGTPQDRDTRLAKMLSEAQSAFCHAIERSAATCPTEVTIIGGNHDRTLSVALQMILAAYFRNDARVKVDVTATSRKYVEWGKCLIGLTHGDTARKRLPNLMQSERREAWGRSKCAEWHHGHFHREAQTVTEGGVTIREHLALCPPDGWHATEGYVGSPRGMDTVLYHADGYPQGWWRHTVLGG